MVEVEVEYLDDLAEQIYSEFAVVTPTTPSRRPA